MNNFSRLVVFFLFSALCLLSSCMDTKPKDTISKEELATKDTVPERLLRHVVLFKFKDDTPDAEAKKMNDSFNALPEAISVIKDFEWGINNSPEDLHQGFTHCYLISFASEEDRDSVYLPHPAHQAFVASIQPYIEKALVVDYWANR